MNAEKLMETIKNVKIPHAYQFSFEDAHTISAVANGEVFQSMVYAYRYGYLKGQRAEKNEAKRAQKELLDGSEWYGYLTRWLKRNIGNEQLLKMLGIRARNLEYLMKDQAVRK